MFRRIIDIAVMLVCTSVFLWSAHGYITTERNKESSKDIEELTDIVTDTASDIIAWYIGDEYGDYFEQVSATYRSGVDIDFQQKSSLEFFENIDKLNRSDERAPDIYIIDSELLEKACYAGLAKENSYLDLYTTENYSDIALASSIYNNILYAYPLFFRTSFLVINTDYVTDVPATFEDITTYAEEFDTSEFEAFENVLKWDTNNLLYNYGFVGSYIDIGGIYGDDETIVDIDRDNLLLSLEYYQSLSQYFSINIDKVNDDSVVDEFIEGKTAFILTGIEGLKKIEDSEINYAVSEYPEISEELSTTTMSATKIIVVNPYSDNIESAEQIAKYMSYDFSNMIYEYTGSVMGTREYLEYESETIAEVMKQYANSKSLPKLMDRLDLYIHLGNTLNNIWSGDDVETSLEALEESIY